MAQYRYKARTADGKKKTGRMEAADEADVQRRLHEEDVFLIDARPVRQGHSRRALKPKLLADFSRQLGTLLGAGVSLVRALRIIADGEATKPKEKEIYEDLIRQIRQGIPLSDAMDAQNGAFPPLMVSMFRSAQSSGNLDQVCIQVAQLYEKEHKLNAKISTSLVYPKILAVMIVAVVMILTKFVLPRFQELFDQMDTLPLSTQILMGCSYVLEQMCIRDRRGGGDGGMEAGTARLLCGFRAVGWRGDGEAGEDHHSR